MKFDHDLDALGLLCPLPVLKARKRMMQLEPEMVLRLQSDDPAALIDVPHYCAESGHELIRHEKTAAGHQFFIRKK